MSGVKISAAEGNDTVFANTADAPCIIGIDIDETVNEYIPVIKGLDPCIVDPENAGSIIWGSMIRPPDRTGYADAMIPAVIIFDMHGCAFIFRILLKSACRTDPPCIVEIRPVLQMNMSRIFYRQCPFLNLIDIGGSDLIHGCDNDSLHQGQIVPLKIDPVVAFRFGSYADPILHLCRNGRSLKPHADLQIGIPVKGISLIIGGSDPAFFIFNVIFRKSDPVRRVKNILYFSFLCLPGRFIKS